MIQRICIMYMLSGKARAALGAEPRGDAGQGGPAETNKAQDEHASKQENAKDSRSQSSEG